MNAPGMEGATLTTEHRGHWEESTRLLQDPSVSAVDAALGACAVPLAAVAAQRRAQAAGDGLSGASKKPAGGGRTAGDARQRPRGLQVECRQAVRGAQRVCVRRWAGRCPLPVDDRVCVIPRRLSFRIRGRWRGGALRAFSDSCCCGYEQPIYVAPRGVRDLRPPDGAI